MSWVYSFAKFTQTALWCDQYIAFGARSMDAVRSMAHKICQRYVVRFLSMVIPLLYTRHKSGLLNWHRGNVVMIAGEEIQRDVWGIIRCCILTLVHNKEWTVYINTSRGGMSLSHKGMILGPICQIAHWPLWDFITTLVTFKLMFTDDGWSIACETTFKWLSLQLTVDKSILSGGIKLSHCWPSSMSPYGVTRLQCV